MTISYIPILFVDVAGSLAMIIFALLSLYSAKILRELDRDNSIFLYLMWVCSGFTLFAVSRSFSHILRQFLLLTMNKETWVMIGPYTGTINTVSFMLIAMITLFFGQIWNINEKIFSSKKQLENTHAQLMDLNQTLEQKVVERTEMLTSSEHKCRRIFEQSLDSIIVTDDHFFMKEINPAGVELTGYTKDKILFDNMNFKNFFTFGSEWDRIQYLILSNEFILNEEIDFLREDKTSVLVLVTGGVDYGAFGCGRTYHFIIKNINERRQMERQIIQADKLAALGELSAGVAHEINNPLGIILGYTQLLLKEEPKHKQDLKTIEKHVKNCQVVVSDLLSFSRKGSVKKAIININTILKDITGFLSNHADFKNIDIIIDLDHDSSLNILGNEQEIGQVIMNLLINACHAIKEQGKIEITTKSHKDQILITIADDGTGIEKKNISKIFDPFFTTKPVGQGTGLGLSVGYGIVKQHGGGITVKSKLGEGAAFTIILPQISSEKEELN